MQRCKTSRKRQVLLNVFSVYQSLCYATMVILTAFVENPITDWKLMGKDGVIFPLQQNRREWGIGACFRLPVQFHQWKREDFL